MAANAAPADVRLEPPSSTVPHSVPEAVADAGILLLGLASVLVGTVVLVSAAIARPGWLGLLVVVPYLLGLIASFAFSTVYNMASRGRLKAVLRRYDHAAIYLLIAGTYTPIVSLSLRTSWSLALLGLVWAGAIGGMALKLLASGRYERLGLALYLLLGWVGVVALLPLAGALSPWQLAALGAGGLLYTGGVAFHLARGLPFHDALWHAAVLAAAAAHYLLVLTLVSRQA